MRRWRTRAPLAYLGLGIIAILLLYLVSIRLGDDGWRETGDMREARSGHHAVLLDTGQVLVVDSFVPPTRIGAELYDPSTGQWRPANSLTPFRSSVFTATKLPDGRVLVTGGRDAAIYDPVADRWQGTAPLAHERRVAQAVLLADGSVLVLSRWVDGRSQERLSGERYDPVTNRWTPIAMAEMREGPSTTPVRLPDGRVLVFSGRRAELYDPVTDTWQPVAGPLRATAWSATLLDDGTVLITGRNRAERFDPVSSTWRPAGQVTADSSHAVTRLADGRVMVTGGYTFGFDPDTIDPRDPVGFLNKFRPGAVDKTEIYNPATNTWTEAASLPVPREKHSLTLLPDGDVLVAGGVEASIFARLLPLWLDTKPTARCERYTPRQ